MVEDDCESTIAVDWRDVDGQELLVTLRLDFKTLAEEVCGTGVDNPEGELVRLRVLEALVALTTLE